MAETEVRPKVSLRKRLWWLPLVWVEWDEDGNRWVMVKWKWEW